MKPIIRVAMMIQGYAPRIGGAERQLAALAPLLREQSVEVSVLTRRYAGLAPFERVEGVPVYRLPIPGPYQLGSLVFTLAALPLLARLRPHIVHAHELLSPTTTALAAKRVLGCPVVAKVLRGGVDGDLAKLRRNRLSARRVAIIRDRVDAFVAISREIDGELAALGVPQERRAFIPNGVDLDRFAPAAPCERQALRAQLGLPDVPIAVFSGRLAPEKRIDLLLATWPEVRAAHPDALLLLVGEGPEQERYARAAGCMGARFAGAVADVAPYLRAADLFVLPSATEGLSNALLEALAAGLPAVATSVGGTPDILANGESGLLVPAGDPPALLRALLALLGDGALRERFGKSGRARVSGAYALPATALRLRALYDQLIAAKAKTVVEHY
jgi:glycosyltransferase involved in cell wall biosynthesis